MKKITRKQVERLLGAAPLGSDVSGLSLLFRKRDEDSWHSIGTGTVYTTSQVATYVHSIRSGVVVY